MSGAYYFDFQHKPMDFPGKPKGRLKTIHTFYMIEKYALRPIRSIPIYCGFEVTGRGPTFNLPKGWKRAVFHGLLSGIILFFALKWILWTIALAFSQ